MCKAWASVSVCVCACVCAQEVEQVVAKAQAEDSSIPCNPSAGEPVPEQRAPGKDSVPRQPIIMNTGLEYTLRLL